MAFPTHVHHLPSGDYHVTTSSITPPVVEIHCPTGTAFPLLYPGHMTGAYRTAVYLDRPSATYVPRPYTAHGLCGFLYHDIQHDIYCQICPVYEAFRREQYDLLAVLAAHAIAALTPTPTEVLQ